MRPIEPPEKTPLDQRVDAAKERFEMLCTSSAEEVDPQRELLRKQARAIIALGLMVRGAP